MAVDKTLIRKKIKKEIQATEKLILGLKEQVKPVEPDKAIGRLTRMDAIQQKSMAEANLRSAHEKLLLLRETETKLDQTDFGICNRCKKRIPLERIMVMPEARVCVACAE